MNVMLASGGFPWTIITLERRTDYMSALEKASVEQNIHDFAKFIIYFHCNLFFTTIFIFLIFSQLIQLDLFLSDCKPDFEIFQTFYQHSSVWIFVYK